VDYDASKELLDHSPSFTFPLRNRFIQQGVGVKLIACVTAKPAPKVGYFSCRSHITIIIIIIIIMWLVQWTLPLPRATSMPADFVLDDRQLSNQC